MTLTQTRPTAVAVQPAADAPVISIGGLAVDYGQRGRSAAVQEFALELAPGEIVAIVGESGSGKSTTANAILGLLPRGAHATATEFVVAGHDLASARPADFRKIRGRVVGFVPQDPMVALNPTQTIGKQVGESLRLWRDVPKREVPRLVADNLRRVGLEDVDRVANQYPHQLSGGMRQRVLIAMALAPQPSIIIADEPTSALDVTIQKRILDDLERAARREGTALIIITHDLGVAAERADRVLVMCEGRIVEEGKPDAVLADPQHDYTRRLLAAAPSLSVRTVVRERATSRRAEPQGGALVHLDAISKSFAVRGPAGSRRHRVLEQVSLELFAGSTLALVGESGSGKSTVARIAAGLDHADSGVVRVDGRDVREWSRAEHRRSRWDLQFVYQNPFASLDPSSSIEQIIVEPLINFRIGTRQERRRRAHELLERVDLPAALLNQRPVHLSGGQRQRIAIARALALDPKVLILDEPVSALDVSVQHQVLELLRELQQERGLAYLFVSHDLAVVAQIADRVAVLAGGRIVEHGRVDRIFTDPQHALTTELLAAIPGLAAFDQEEQ